MTDTHKMDNPVPSPEELFTRYAPLVYKIASGYLQNPEDCRECIDDTFLEFYKHPERYDPQKGSLAAYLSAIAAKRAVSKWRKNRRSGEAGEAFSKDSSMPVHAGTTEDPAEKIVQQMDLEQALLALNGEELNLIRQKYYDGMSIREIAEKMQVPYETVKKRHQRTLKKLRLLLLAIMLLALLAGCAFFFARKIGIIPGYGAVDEEDGPLYCLEEPVTVPVPGTEWEARITTAFYQGDCLTVSYYLTDREGHRLSDQELGCREEILGDTVWEHNHSISFSAQSFLYVGAEHAGDFGPLETTFINSTGPAYSDHWLEADNLCRLEALEDGDCYQILEPAWKNNDLASVWNGEEEITVTFASDLVLTEEESGLVWKNGDGSDFDSWYRQLSEEKHRFEATLTLRAVYPDQLEDYACDYDEENGGILAIPRLQEGRLIVAVYPLQGESGRIVNGLVSTNRYQGTADEPEIGNVTVEAEDGTVLVGELLGGIQSDAKLYSEWDFGPAKAGTYTLRIPYLLKYYEGEGKLQKALIPFSCKRGTVGSRSVELEGIKITVSGLQPMEWGELLSGTSREAGLYHELKDTPFYRESDRLWSFWIETEVPYPEETVVDLSLEPVHRRARFFPLYGDNVAVAPYDLPEDGRLKWFLYWEDAQNRISGNPMDSWFFQFYVFPADEDVGLPAAPITTRWEHPVELEFAVEEEAE